MVCCCSQGLWSGQDPPGWEGFPLGAQRGPHGRGETVWRHPQVRCGRHQAGDHDQSKSFASGGARCAVSISVYPLVVMTERLLAVSVEMICLSRALYAESSVLCFVITGENAQREKRAVMDRFAVSIRIDRKYKESGGCFLCPQLSERRSKAPEGLSSHPTKLQGPPSWMDPSPLFGWDWLCFLTKHEWWLMLTRMWSCCTLVHYLRDIWTERKNFAENMS